MLSGGGVGSSVAGGTARGSAPVSSSSLTGAMERYPLRRHSCLDERRIVGAFAEGVAQPVDRSMEPVFEVDEGVRGPEMLAEQLAGDELARSLEQEDKQVEGLPA